MSTFGTIDIQRDGVFVEQRRVGEAVFTIGRAEGSGLVLADPTVSREHARIETLDGHHVLIDATGRGRTLLNGQPVERQELQAGDQIAIGPYVLVYRPRPAPARQDMARTETLLAFSPVGLPLYEQLAAKATAGRLDSAEARLWAVAAKLQACTGHAQAAACLLREAMELIPSDHGQVVHPGEDEGLNVAAVIPEEDDDRDPLSASVVRQVLATGQALACLDVSQDRRFRASMSLAGRGASSVMAVPLVMGGRVAGAICLLREDETARYSAADLERLATIAQIAAVVLPPSVVQAIRGGGDRPLRRQADLPYPLVYRSAIMQGVTQQVLRVAATDATVLITGPSGAGKELIAAAMHYGSLRSAGPFVKVNCAAIPETLIESELFGHERGAFTDAKTERKGRFEQADGGTLFLDEIGDMPLAIQTRLLRALETRMIERVGGSSPIHVRVRLIAATNHHLPSLVKQGKFREDLWYRLDVVRIDLPALKDRIEDVPLLFKTFAESFAANMQAQPVRLSDDAIDQLCGYDWPGNVRQLRNLAERLTVFHAGERVTGEVVMSRLGRPDTAASPSPAPAPADSAPPAMADGPIRSLAEARTDFEKAYIRRALTETGGNITKAAELLGLARENLSRKIKQLGLET